MPNASHHQEPLAAEILLITIIPLYLTLYHHASHHQEPLAVVAALVSSRRPAEAGPFVLRIPFPRAEFATEEELSLSLSAVGLSPRGTLLVVPLEHKGLVRQATSTRE